MRRVPLPVYSVPLTIRKVPRLTQQRDTINPVTLKTEMKHLTWIIIVFVNSTS